MFNRNEKRVVKSRLKVSEYIPVVDVIVSGYFDSETGAYQPHIGSITTLITFYNLFYKTEDEAFINDVNDASKFADDEKFMEAFNDAITIKAPIGFDFAHAYCDAMAVVDSRSQSIAQLVEYVKPLVKGMIDRLDTMMKPENVDKIAVMAKAVSDGSISVKGLLNNYVNSDEFKEQFGDKPTDNVTPINKGKK